MALIEFFDTADADSAVSPPRGRLAIVGESIVAVDLINTVAAPGSAAAGDLLAADRGAQAWWRAEAGFVPDTELPDRLALRRLRSVLRKLIEALVDHQPVSPAAVADLNFFMQSAPASRQLQLTGAGLGVQTQWHGEYGGNARLAFIATQAAEFLSEPRAGQLRRCANPACSMIFVAVNPRRSWCAPAVCGNRVRVARHHRRTSGI